MAQTEYPAQLWDLIDEVRDWSNRDEDQVSDKLIVRCLQYAADTAYRELKIPPLEQTVTYTLDSDDFITDTRIRTPYITLQIPSDLVSFVYIKVRGEGLVFNEKTDERTFFDEYANHKSCNRFTRIGNALHVTGLIPSPTYDTDGVNKGNSVIEMHYYRRLAALDARYTVNAINYDNGSGTYLTEFPDYDGTGTVIADGQEVTPDSEMIDGVKRWFVGREIENWLRDDNKKILVFGALHHLFDYLGDTNMSQLWFQKAVLAIEELNKEEKFRRASGGNVSINFNSRLI